MRPSGPMSPAWSTICDTALDANGDTSAHIVGITYPDVILGDYIAPVGATDPVLAAVSAFAFDI